VLLTFDRLPELLLLALGRADAPAVVQLVQLGVSALALLPSTLLIGATFPCAVAAWAGSPARAGEAVGRLYAVNTAGAIVGAILAGFVLVPALGVHATLQVGILVNLGLAADLSVA
jgi:spermidine synthase